MRHLFPLFLLLLWLQPLAWYSCKTDKKRQWEIWFVRRALLIDLFLFVQNFGVWTTSTNNQVDSPIRAVSHSTVNCHVETLETRGLGCFSYKRQPSNKLPLNVTPANKFAPLFHNFIGLIYRYWNFIWSEILYAIIYSKRAIYFRTLLQFLMLYWPHRC